MGGGREGEEKENISHAYNTAITQTESPNRKWLFGTCSASTGGSRWMTVASGVRWQMSPKSLLPKEQRDKYQGLSFTWNRLLVQVLMMSLEDSGLLNAIVVCSPVIYLMFYCHKREGCADLRENKAKSFSQWWKWKALVLGSAPRLCEPSLFPILTPSPVLINNNPWITSRTLFSHPPTSPKTTWGSLFPSH